MLAYVHWQTYHHWQEFWGVVAAPVYGGLPGAGLGALIGAYLVMRLQRPGQARPPR